MMERIDETGCIGEQHIFRTHSGLWFDILDPKPDQIALGDIAYALARVCRFAGHTEGFYSVAEHSVLCAMQARADGLSIDAQQAILMHDATEAYIGDITRPLKRLLPGYVEIESRIQRVIGEKFKLRFSANRTAIKKIDNEILAAEMRLICGGIYGDGLEAVRQLDPSIVGWWPNNAAWHFLDMATSLGISNERNCFEVSRNETSNARPATRVSHPGDGLARTGSILRERGDSIERHSQA